MARKDFWNSSVIAILGKTGEKSICSCGIVGIVSQVYIIRICLHFRSLDSWLLGNMVIGKGKEKKNIFLALNPNLFITLSMWICDLWVSSVQEYGNTIYCPPKSHNHCRPYCYFKLILIYLQTKLETGCI